MPWITRNGAHVFLDEATQDSFDYVAHLKENRDKIMDVIDDEIRHTKLSKRDVMVQLAASEDLYKQNLLLVAGDKYTTKQMAATEKTIKHIVDRGVLSNVGKNDQAFEDMLERQKRAQMNSAFR